MGGGKGGGVKAWVGLCKANRCNCILKWFGLVFLLFFFFCLLAAAFISYIYEVREATSLIDSG